MAVLKLGPAVLDLEVYVGDENRVPVEVLADGAPVDLTGAAIAAQARTDTKTATPIAVEAVVEEVDLAVGRFDLTWDGEALRTLVGDTGAWLGVWDLQITPAGRTLPDTPLGGRFTASPDVTRVVP